MALALIAGGIGFRVVNVLRYAELQGPIDVLRDENDGVRLKIRLRPNSTGAIDLRRAKEVDATELDSQSIQVTALGESEEFREFAWNLPELTVGDEILVTYREGWSLKTVKLTTPARSESAPAETQVAAGESASEVPRVEGQPTKTIGSETRGELALNNPPVAVVAEPAKTVVEPAPAVVEPPPPAKILAPAGVFGRRTEVAREQWIDQLGGTPASELAVQEGLNWLARHQARDGSWRNSCLAQQGTEWGRCEAFPGCNMPGQNYEASHTGLAVLAFQAGGHYAFNDSKYSKHVRRGLDWLIARQNADGFIGGSRGDIYEKDPAFKKIKARVFGADRFAYHPHFMYEHGMATYALAEACALAKAEGQTPDPKLVKATLRAIEFIGRMQHADGGWRYQADPSERSDTSVSGWSALALNAAREAELPFDEQIIDKAIRFFLSCEDFDEGRTGYQYPRQHISEASTGVGMLARQFLAKEPDVAFVKRSANFLADFAERQWSRRVNVTRLDFYTWYNCSIAMYQVGGEPWARWNGVVRDLLISLQEGGAGCSRGSWAPNDPHGELGGRIYSTALAVLTLEVYYRYGKLSDLSAKPLE